MPLWGKVYSGAYGDSDSIIESIQGFNYGGGILARIRVRSQYTERNFAICVNGTFICVVSCGETPEFDVTVTGEYSTGAINSFYLEDIGQLTDLPAETIAYVVSHAHQHEALTANRLSFNWDNIGVYTLSAPSDPQLSSLVITGARRNVNCDVIPEIPTRARLYYVISQKDATVTIKWYTYDNTQVAEGTSTTAGGSFTCTEINNSGISITGTLAFAHITNLGETYVDIKWPKSYKVYYSTSAINYNAAPRATVLDKQNESFSYLSSVLIAGLYNANVIAVDDEGDIQTTLVDKGPYAVLTVPAAPVITSVAQLSPYNFRITFTAQNGTTSTCYFSNVNEPVNFGNLTDGPTPVVATPPHVDITVNGYTTQNDTAAYNTLEAAVDVAISDCNLYFPYGDGPAFYWFPVHFTTCKTAIEEAFATFANAVKLPLFSKTIALVGMGQQTYNALTFVATQELPLAQWIQEAGNFYGQYIRYLGNLLEDNSSRYPLPEGVVITGTVAATKSSVWDIIQPLKKQNYIGIIVRSAIAGNEELNNQEYLLQLDDDGNGLFPKPNKARIISYSLAKGANRSITVIGGVNDDNFTASAYLDLYVTPVGATIDLNSPNASVAVRSNELGDKQGTFSAVTIAPDTWYQIAVLARTADNARSATYDFKYIYDSTDAAPEPADLSIYVLRSGI